MIKAITQVEEECVALQNQALLKKDDIIKEAKEKAKTMLAEFENHKKEITKKALDDAKIKNDEQMQIEIENAKIEIEKLKQVVKEKEQGAISLVMSCIA